MPRSIVRTILDRGLSPEILLPEYQDPFTPATSQYIYGLVYRSLTSRHKSWATISTELNLASSVKKIRRWAMANNLRRCKALAD